MEKLAPVRANAMLVLAQQQYPVPHGPDRGIGGFRVSFRTAKGVVISVLKGNKKRKVEGVHSFSFPLPELNVSGQYFLHETAPYVVTETLSAEKLQIICHLDYTDEVHVWLIKKMYDPVEVEFRIDFPTGDSCVFWGYVTSTPVSANITSADSVTLNVIATKPPKWTLG